MIPRRHVLVLLLLAAASYFGSLHERSSLFVSASAPEPVRSSPETPALRKAPGKAARIVAAAQEKEKAYPPCQVESPADSPTVATQLDAFFTGKTNIFFSREEFLQDALARDDEYVRTLTEVLVVPPETESAGDDFVKERNPEILQRMAAVDVLEALAHAQVTQSSATDAQAALALLVARPLPAALSDGQRRAMVGEKFDALSALARSDAKKAAATFCGLSHPGQKKVLRRALFFGAGRYRHSTSRHGRVVAAVDGAPSRVCCQLTTWSFWPSFSPRGRLSK